MNPKNNPLKPIHYKFDYFFMYYLSNYKLGEDYVGYSAISVLCRLFGHRCV